MDNVEIKVTLTAKELVILTAALGDTSREKLHEAIASDYNEEMAQKVMPLPKQGAGVLDFILTVSQDATGPLYERLNEIVMEDIL